MRNWLALLVATLVLTGCSPSTAYRKAEERPPIKVPGDMVFEGEQPLYPIPDNGPRAQWDKANDKFQVPGPPQIREPEAEPSDEQAPPARAENTRVVLARDGNGYPIIMMHTRFAWAWEYVGQALREAGFKIDDRDRESGLYYIDLPEPYREKKRKSAQIKLSHTANGIQIAVLKADGTALLDKGPGQDILSRLYEEL